MNMTVMACKILLTVALALFNAAASNESRQHAAEQDTQRSAPQIENAKVETRNVAGTLAATLADLQKSAASPMWIGYAVKAVAGQRTICCGTSSDGNEVRCGKCELETGRDHWSSTHSNKDVQDGTGKSTVKLEAGQLLTVLFRLQDHQVIRIKLASPDCVLDARGLPFVWLTDVNAAESVKLLAGYVRKENGDGHSIGNEALTAIALHDGQDAEAALESFAAPLQPEELRKQTAFWFGAARGKEGFSALQRIAKNDPSREVRAQVTFALSVSEEPAALDEMIRMAHEDADGHVRGQAIFWLAQKAGKRAVGAIDGAIANDPDTEVKKQAVFALSQLPKDEGVPKLIQVAENNRNPEVRKQAMFWLGQSEDKRALDFFEKVLTGSSR